MDDKDIIELFLSRDEIAIHELSEKYGSFCHRIAWNILRNYEDSDECVNDAWMAVWTSIPPHEPNSLAGFCGKIVRRISIDRLRKRCALKRPDTAFINIEEELRFMEKFTVKSVETEYLEKETLHSIEKFLQQQPEFDRVIFIRRYWYFDSLQEIANVSGKSVGSIKIKLHRIRAKLSKYMEELEE